MLLPCSLVYWKSLASATGVSTRKSMLKLCHTLRKGHPSPCRESTSPSVCFQRSKKYSLKKTWRNRLTWVACNNINVAVWQITMLYSDPKLFLHHGAVLSYIWLGLGCQTQVFLMSARRCPTPSISRVAGNASLNFSS